MQKLLFPLLLMLMTSGLTWAQPITEDSPWVGRQNAAPSRIQISAQQRNIEEAYQYLLGSQGKSQDNTQALQLIYQEAERGFLTAQVLLGTLYAQGRVVKADRSQALLWLEKAAYRNHPVAQYHLGLLLAQSGQSNTAKDDLIGAFVWWKKAADQGNTRAKAALKELDYRLTQKDKKRAFALWEESRKQIVVDEPLEVATEEAASQAVTVRGQIQLTNVVGRWVKNRAAGNLFIISGFASNAYPQPRSKLVVIAKLQGPQGQILVEASAFCGNEIVDSQLMELPFQQIQQTMKNDAGLNGSNINVKPGGTVPFTVVFKDLPPNVAQYTVKARSLPGS